MALIKMQIPKGGNDPDKVQLVPRYEDGMYFFEVYHNASKEGDVFASDGEAYHAAQEMAARHNTTVVVWPGWW